MVIPTTVDARAPGSFRGPHEAGRHWGRGDGRSDGGVVAVVIAAVAMVAGLVALREPVRRDARPPGGSGRPHRRAAAQADRPGAGPGRRLRLGRRGLAPGARCRSTSATSSTPGASTTARQSRWAKLPDGSSYEMLVYTPPAAATGYRSYATFTPADRDPNLDADDEVALLAADVGQLAPGSAGNPQGVNVATRERVDGPRPPRPAGGRLRLPVREPEPVGAARSRAGSTTASASTPAPTRTTYRMGTASNPPNNLLGSEPRALRRSPPPAYRISYADRWLNDGLVIREGGGSGADLLDRAQYPVPNVGVRPQRGHLRPAVADLALRGGVHRQRERTGAGHPLAHRGQQLRLHGADRAVLPAPAGHGDRAAGPRRAARATRSYDDLTTGLAGMTYSDNANTNLAIDGHGRPFTPISWVVGSGTPPTVWQLVKGPAGSIVTTRTLDTDGDRRPGHHLVQGRQPRTARPRARATPPRGVRTASRSSLRRARRFPNTDPTLGAESAEADRHPHPLPARSSGRRGARRPSWPTGPSGRSPSP